MKIPVALQLYTVRQQIQKDFAAAVRDVARLGYPAVELAGFGNFHSAGDVRRVLDENNLEVAGAHVPFELLEHDLQKVLQDQATLGSRHAICSWVPPNRREDAAGWAAVARLLNQTAEQCQEAGVELVYHNHDFEFRKFDGKAGLDILLENTDPNLLKLELDVYWIKFGGEDPIERISRHRDRLVLVHLKDMAADGKRDTELGNGILDIRGMVEAAAGANVKWYVVEQDDTHGTPPLEACRISLDNLRKAGFA